MKIWLCKKYVDDVLIICNHAKRGSRYRNGTVVETGDSIREDQGKSNNQITLNLLIEVANAQIPFLEVTGEFSDGENQKVPCLDSQLWLGSTQKQSPWFTHQLKDGEAPGSKQQEEDERTVQYQFFKKTMSNSLTLMKASAMPESTKVATVASELLRRWKTTSVELGQEVFE